MKHIVQAVCVQYCICRTTVKKTTYGTPVSAVCAVVKNIVQKSKCNYKL